MKIKVLLVLLCLSSLGFSQASRFDSVVDTTVTIAGQTGLRKIVAGAQVTLCTYPAATFGACVKVALCTDETGSSCSTSTNPVTVDAYGNFGFWVSPGKYDYWITANAVNSGPYHIVVGPDVTAPLSAKNLNGIRFADQFGGFTGTAIQAAINDLPATGGTVYLAAGTWWVGSNLPITIGNKQGVKVVGAGDGTVLTICGNLSDNANCTAVPGATTDLFSIAPTGSFQQGNLVFSDFKVLTLSGSPGRYGFNFDGTNGLTFQTTIERVHFFNPMGGANIFANGSGMGNGNLRTSLINNNSFSEPIICHQCGDTVRITNNAISGTGNGIDVDFITGAAVGIISGNNIVVSGGCIHLGALAVSTQVIGNECETPVGATGSNGALIDVDGSAGNIAAHDTISWNSFQIINSSTLNSLRINYCTSCMVYDNRFARGGAPSKDIVVTANAVGTQIGTNKWSAGFPFASMLSDSGTGTTLLGMFSGSMITNSGMQFTTPVAGGGSLNPGLYLFNTGHFTFGVNSDCGTVLCVSGDLSNANGIVIPSTTTGFHGTASGKLQTSDNTGSTGNYAKFDANGSVTNGPTAASIPTVGTPTAGQAACIKSVGPPVVIGYCSTTPTSGTCTCN